MTQKAFNNCVKSGGKVKTKDLKNDKYIKICYDKAGKSHASKIMKKGNEDKKPKAQDKKIPVISEESLLQLKEYYNSNRL